MSLVVCLLESVFDSNVDVTLKISMLNRLIRKIWRPSTFWHVLLTKTIIIVFNGNRC